MALANEIQRAVSFLIGGAIHSYPNGMGLAAALSALTAELTRAAWITRSDGVTPEGLAEIVRKQVLDHCRNHEAAEIAAAQAEAKKATVQ